MGATGLSAAHPATWRTASAGPLQPGDGDRDTRAPPRGRRPTPPLPQTPPVLGRPRLALRADPPTAPPPTGHPRNTPGMAPPPHPAKMATTSGKTGPTTDPRRTADADPTARWRCPCGERRQAIGRPSSWRWRSCSVGDVAAGRLGGGALQTPSHRWVYGGAGHPIRQGTRIEGGGPSRQDGSPISTGPGIPVDNWLGLSPSSPVSARRSCDVLSTI
jgi:hypothetical protein